MGILGVNNDTVTTIKATDWREGTVTHILTEAPGLRSFTFTFDSPIKHAAGQHYEIRLTAENGYQAARLYSAAMPANGTGHMLQLTIANIPNGEVSPYLFHNVGIGDRLEIRGPLGGYFVWTLKLTKPVLLIGGGTGIVPLRAIRLSHQQTCSEAPLRLLYSVKTYEDMAYKYELFPRSGDPPEDVEITFTGAPPPGWRGLTGRIDNSMLNEVLNGFKTSPMAYVCGPTPMVESVTQALVALGLDASVIHAERFGATS